MLSVQLKQVTFPLRYTPIPVSVYFHASNSVEQMWLFDSQLTIN